MPLTEYANNNPTESLVVIELIKNGILAGTPTGNIVITAYSEEGPKDVIIPSKMDGKQVTIIGKAAFHDMGLTSVVIPNTIIDIQEFAFETNSLQHVVIPENVEYIRMGAFSYNSLETVIIENNNIGIDSGTFCGNPFAEDVNSESYQKIYRIEQYAFHCGK